jgi:hypothetical protein
LLLSTFVVDNTADSGAGSLRQAIVDANAAPGSSDIVFHIPASKAADLDVPVPGFDPTTQDWTITLASPLPAVTNSVTIDGFSQAQFPVPYRYPTQTGNAVQTLAILGSPTGGTFTLSTQSPPLPGGTTPAIPYNATAATVQADLEQVVGAGNVVVTGGPGPDQPYIIEFIGAFARETVLPLQLQSNNLTGGNAPGVSVDVVAVGGTGLSAPTEIQSSPNTLVARGGNNAVSRVIIDGIQTVGASGFVLDSSSSTLRGLIVTDFAIGVSIPNATNVGNLIEGNFIGQYVVYPVDPLTGVPVPAPNDAFKESMGNSFEGIDVYGDNTTIGGTEPQENNVIAGNGTQGVRIEAAATGVFVEGNQIGMIGPLNDGRYFQAGNGAEGVLVFGSSNQIGGPSPTAIGFTPDPGNVISGNGSDGVRISGAVATRNIVAGNIIGLAAGGGYKFGTGNPGNSNGGDGVLIENAADNQIGGPTAEWGNTISSNSGAGVFITGATSIGNTIANNKIGVTIDGESAKGNALDGVADYSPQTIIGPGNLISGNLRGVLISGPNATGAVVEGNLIGTDITGVYALSNEEEGVRIDSASGATIEGNAAGSQVISGNLLGVLITGTASTGNLLAGNLIGTDASGLNALPNSREGVSIIDGSANTVGGTTSGSLNVISGNEWGIRLGGLATNNLIAGNNIGTDINRAIPIPNEVDGIIINAAGNTVGGTSAAAANTIAYNRVDGVLVQSGAGNSILSNHIYSNTKLGIELLASGSPPPNNFQFAPVLTQVTSNASSTHIQGTLTSAPSTTFLIQFFTSIGAALLPNPQGQNLFAATEVTTGMNGVATIDLVVNSPLPAGARLTATATKVTTGDTSEFSGSISEVTAIGFVMATYVVDQTSGSALIAVERTQDIGTSTVHFATVAGGTAVPGVDYTPTSGTLTFDPGQLIATFTIGIFNTQQPGGVKTVDLALSNPTGGVLDPSFNPTAVLQITHLTGGTGGMFTVVNTNDAGPGSLRQAIINADSIPGAHDITFDIPAATDPVLQVPVPGFDPVTQDWTINLQSPLPPITNTVTIDGFSQAEAPVPFRYPVAISSATQQIAINGFPDGGTYTLTTLAPLPVGTTVPIPIGATPAQVQAAIEAVIGPGTVSVTGTVAGLYFVAFQGKFAHEAIPDLIPAGQLIGGTNPSVTVATIVAGGLADGDPVLIQSTPNNTPAYNGNDAVVRVIVEGGGTLTGPGFLLEASHSAIRGLAIDGFGIGVSVPAPQFNGDLIQGNFVGRYLVYQVDSQTGLPLQAPNNVVIAGLGNSLQGVYLDSLNTIVGGTNPQENNVIAGNGLQGVWIDVGGKGNVIEGNQIGVLGPSTNGRYFQAGNGADGVLVDGSSNLIGVAGTAAANVISANFGDGVHIVGPVATQDVVSGNLIGTAPGGGFLFGTGNPGNAGNGVLIENSPQNQIGGADSTFANVISSNGGAGVYITGAGSTGNIVSHNVIGLTADGEAAKGNGDAGVAVYSPQNTIGSGNVISGNLLGVGIYGPGANQVVVVGNLIGTDRTGLLILGNTETGILIQNSTSNVVEGNGAGSQVISGNNVGVEISGAGSQRNLVAGNFIGTNQSGTGPLPNALEGVRIDSGAGNTVGGTTAAARNLISADHWGVRINGSTATSNVVEGNFIGTDVSGVKPLGNEVNGVVISDNASGNLIGGRSKSAGNIIAFNTAAGVAVQSGISDSILTNSIYSNGVLGIQLLSGANHNQPAPVLSSIQSVVSGTNILGTLKGTPNTTYTIQFFSNAVPGPGGFGEGQTFLGQITATTNGSGVVEFTGNVPVAISSLQPFITATATSSSGDTSEFSRAVTPTPLTVMFSMAVYSVSQTAGTVTIAVIRSGAGPADTVAYATANVSAKAGVNYVAATGVLDFAAGQTELTFTISILNTQQVGGTKSFTVSLSDPTGGLTLGTPSTATVVIQAFTTPGPTVQSLQLLPSYGAITAIVLTFSEPLIPSRAVNLLNYGYSVQASRNMLDGITSATYNAKNDSVTLQLEYPIFTNAAFKLSINQSTDTSSVPVGVADTSGNLLDGNYDGVPGGVFTASFARGHDLTYYDDDGNRVSLRLSHRGTMSLTQHADGSAWQLVLSNVVAGRSTLSGQVRKVAPHATGVTTIPSIVGSAGVRVLLTDPPFVIGAPSNASGSPHGTSKHPVVQHTGSPRPRSRPFFGRRPRGQAARGV